MRAACREFLNATGFEDNRGRPVSRRYVVTSLDEIQLFHLALGKLRGLVGVQIVLMVSQYGLKVEEGLATIMPPPED